MRKYILIILLLLLKQYSCFANDTCTLKASFYPSKDTLAAINFNTVFNNTTTGATNYTWLRDGVAVNSPGVYNYSTSKVGTNEVALAVSNGICVDTARVYVVITGMPPVTRDHYKLALSLPGVESQARAVVRINNEESVLGGYINSPIGPGAFRKTGFLAALSDDGCVRWSKQTTDIEDKAVSTLKKAVNGDIFVVFDSRILVRLDINGNQKWAKSLPKAGVFLQAYTDLMEDANGNILIFYSGLSMLGIVKLDSNGNMIWARQYKVGTTETVVPNAMVQANGSYYVCGAFVTVTASGGNSGRSSFLSRIDMTTGATLWVEKCSGPTATFMTGMHVYNNQLLINSASDYFGKPGLTYFDFDGVFQKGYQLTQFAQDGTTVLQPLLTNITPLANGDIFWQTKSAKAPPTLIFTAPPPYEFSNSFLRVNSNNQLVWQWTIANKENDQFFNITEGKNQSLLAAGYAISSVTGNVPDPADAVLLKISSNGSFVSDCNAYISTHRLDPAVTIVTPYSWSSESPLSFLMLDQQVPLTNASLPRKWVCPLAVDSCSLLKIKGPNMICDMGRDYTYRIHKTGDCGNTIRVTNGVQIKVVTDTTLIVSFTEKGKQTIKLGQAGSCVALEDSINVNVSAGSVDLITNATICSSDSAVFKLPDGYTGFEVSPNRYISPTSTASQIIVKPQTNTAYVFYLKKTSGCDLSDTAVINLLPINSVNLGNDTVICKGESFTLNITNPIYTRYQWSTGSTNPQISIADKGNYWVKVTDKNNCTYTDTIEVKDLRSTSAFSKPADSVLCIGKTIVWNAPTGMKKIVWQDGSSNNSFLITKPGKYWLTVTDNFQCNNSDTVSILRTINAPIRFLTKDSSICRNDSIILRSSLAFEKYLWSTGNGQPTITVSTAGSYSLTVTDRFNCEWNQKTAITVQDCVYTIFFPNAFTPNNDGLNDQFRPKAFGRLQLFHIDIYNRWGQKIFSSDDWVKGWDGTINRELQNQDTYVWVAQYQFAGETIKTEKGTVVLIR